MDQLFRPFVISNKNLNLGITKFHQKRFISSSEKKFLEVLLFVFNNIDNNLSRSHLDIPRKISLHLDWFSLYFFLN